MLKLTKILLVTFLFSINCGLIYAAVPHLINYQARLTDKSGKPLEGSYIITFRIYDAETAGTLLWEETHSGALIQKGTFGIMLGSVTNLNLAFDKPYWLEIKVGNEVMSPRQRISASAYAIRAEVAEDVVSLPKGVIVMWSGSINNIPSGWALCDGTNGTPDLRDRFIVGARQDEARVAKTNIVGSLTQIGGSTTITEANLPSHSHGAGSLATGSAGAHIHSTNIYDTVGQGEYNGLNWDSNRGSLIDTSSAGTHTHTLSGSTGTTGSSTPYTQPYYALAFIMKL